MGSSHAPHFAPLAFRLDLKHARGVLFQTGMAGLAATHIARSVPDDLIR